MRMAESEYTLERMLQRFETAYNTRNPQLAVNLRELIERSPVLKADIQQSIANGSLTEIRLFENNANNTGAEYSRKDRRILIPEEHLANANTPHRYDEEIIFKLGHEIRHAVDRANGTRDNDQFNSEIWRISETSGDRHDYTQTVANFIKENRESESYAHIGGFNAISSMVRAENPDATLEDIYKAHPARMADFIEVTGTFRKTYAMKENISIDENMQLPYSAANVDAMKTYYFDKSPEEAKLGPNQDWDYRHYYANEAFRRIDIAEQEVATYRREHGEPDARPASVTADLRALELDPNKIRPEYRVTDTPSVQPQALRDGPAQMIERLSPQDRDVFDRGYATVQARGGYSEEQARNIAAAGVLAFNESKSTAAAHDVGVYGDRLRTTQMPYGPDKEPNFPVDVKLADAAQVPAERSLQHVEQLPLQRTQEQTRQQELQTAQSQQQNGPSIGARTFA
jgi:hypothetical protein